MSVNVSISEMAGPEKSRLLKKGAFYVLLVVLAYLIAGAGFFTHYLFVDYFCVRCDPFNSRISIFYLVFFAIVIVGGRFTYKWAKKNELLALQKEALIKTGKATIIEQAFADGHLSPEEILQILHYQSQQGDRPANSEQKREASTTTQEVYTSSTSMPPDIANKIRKLMEKG